MGRSKFGPANNFWKGGRVVSSHGYMLIRVGNEHHLADVRGYAYEHRIKAEKKIGRPLRRGELVHHIYGDKLNNEPDNLEVLRGNAEHLMHHRLSGKRRRNPGERNPMVKCTCGCGEKFRRFDASGRPRTFVSGHNDQPNPTESAILSILSDGKIHHRCQIALAIGGPANRLYGTLSKLKRKALVNNFRGFWQLKEGKRGS